MHLLKVYKNDTLEMQVLSVSHLLSTLEKDYVSIRVLVPQGAEKARIQADNALYTVYDSLK